MNRNRFFFERKRIYTDAGIDTTIYSIKTYQFVNYLWK